MRFGGRIAQAKATVTSEMFPHVASRAAAGNHWPLLVHYVEFTHKECTDANLRRVVEPLEEILAERARGVSEVRRPAPLGSLLGCMAFHSGEPTRAFRDAFLGAQGDYHEGDVRITWR
jgi:hypothetical protein